MFAVLLLRYGFTIMSVQVSMRRSIRYMLKGWTGFDLLTFLSSTSEPALSTIFAYIKSSLVDRSASCLETFNTDTYRHSSQPPPSAGAPSGRYSAAARRGVLLHYGLPERVADVPETWTVWHVGNARTACLSLLMFVFYARRRYDVLVSGRYRLVPWLCGLLHSVERGARVDGRLSPTEFPRVCCPRRCWFHARGFV